MTSDIKQSEQGDDAMDNYSEKNISEYGVDKFNIHSAPIASNDGDDEDYENDIDIDDENMLTTGLVMANH